MEILVAALIGLLLGGSGVFLLKEPRMKKIKNQPELKLKK